MDVGITIDSATTRDRDDAFWIQAVSDDRVVLDVYISDVANAVPRGSRFDGTREVVVEGSETPVRHVGAYERLETIYRANGSVPMLPRQMSENTLSLHPGRARHAMRVRLPIDRGGASVRVCSEEIEVSFVPFRSRHALAYSEVPELLDDTKVSEVSSEMQTLRVMMSLAADIAQKLCVQRRSNGALAIYDLHRGWATNEDGVVVKLLPDEANIGFIIVQEFMILANQQLAMFCARKEIGVLYRNHLARDHAPDRAEIMRQVQDAMGQSMGVLDAVRQRSQLWFQRANYGQTLEGHYGLNLPAYLHGTSPIRRYADLVNQRQIRAFCKGEAPPYSRSDLDDVARHINTTLERRKMATSEHLRQRDRERMEHHLSVPHELARLTDKEFDRAIKLAVRSGPMPSTVRDVFQQRLAHGDVSLLAQAWVLFEGDVSWNEARRAVLSSLEQRPHDAPSLFAIAANTSGILIPRFDVRATDEASSLRFVVTASTKRSGALLQSRPILHTSKKKAEQLACIDLLFVLSGVERSNASNESGLEPHEVPHAPPLPLPCPGTLNPVGALQEQCQIRGIPMPIYTEHPMKGPSHAPMFECRCTALEMHGTGRGMTKKEAKRLAAEDVIRQFLEQQVSP